jgi:hypothetical protein
VLGHVVQDLARVALIPLGHIEDACGNGVGMPPLGPLRRLLNRSGGRV